jgi:hypothetical protein
MEVAGMTRQLVTPERDEEGPRDSYGCACVSRDARTCVIVRCGYREDMTGQDERCECLCHQWSDDDDDY